MAAGGEKVEASNSRCGEIWSPRKGHWAARGSEILGHGSWGVAWRNTANGPDHVVKEIPLNLNAKARSALETLAKSTANIKVATPLVALIENKGVLQLVYPYIDGKLLSEYQNEAFVEGQSHLVFRWALAVASALSELHATGTVHGDLKPTNILMSEGKAVLLDVGISAVLCSALPGEFDSACGSHYRAPELSSTGPSEKTDVYSLGVIVKEALQDCSLHYPRTKPGSVGKKQRAFGIQALSPAMGQVPPKAHRAISACLDRDPTNRPTAAELAAVLAEEPGETPASSHRPKRVSETAGYLSRELRWVPAAVFLTAVACGAASMAVWPWR